MRRREHPPAPAPAFGDLAEDFTAFSLRARLGTDTLDGVAVEVHGPSGEVTGGWIEADEDYVPPFHGVGYRPLEAGRHALTVFQRGGELARLAFDVPEAARIPRRWARLSDSRQRALLDWLDGCGATVVVDRMCKVALPLRSFAGADPPPLGAELRAALEAATGKVVVLPGFADPAESAALVARFAAGGLAPAGEEHAGAGPRKRTNRSGTIDRSDAPKLVEAALGLFPDCDARLVELQIVAYAPGEEYGVHHDVIARAPDGTWRRRTSLFVVLQQCEAGGATAFKRLLPSDVLTPASADWRKDDGGLVRHGRARASENGPLAPGAVVRAASGDALLWHNVDDRGRRDERLEHAGEPVRAGSKWGVNVWLYSCGALQNKATLRAKAPPEVMAELRRFVVDAEGLAPGNYPRDLFKSPQDPTPRDAFPLLAKFASALPPESRGCVIAGAELCVRCCEGYREGERRAFSYCEFLSAGRIAGVATSLQTIAIDNHIAFKIDGVQVGLGSGPPPRWTQPQQSDSDSD